MEPIEPKTKKARVTYHGSLPDDDPIYTKAGWNFLAGANLNLPPLPPSDEGLEKKGEGR